MKVLGAVLALLGATVSVGAIANDQLNPRADSVPTAETMASDAILARGVLELSKGRFDDAYELFEMASQVPSDLYKPNYMPVLYKGLSKCMSGDAKLANQLFEDFSCMSAVALGELPCPAETDAVKLLDLPKQQLGSLTKACAATMCWGPYRRFYKEPTLESRNAVAASLKIMTAFRNSCRN